MRTHSGCGGEEVEELWKLSQFVSIFKNDLSVLNLKTKLARKTHSAEEQIKSSEKAEGWHKA